MIENGVDLPNVNTIIVLNAQRFGMATLYQLRGRVGRSTRQAFAYFMTSANATLTVEAEQRLSFISTFTALGSGYELSRRDMEMRGGSPRSTPPLLNVWTPLGAGNMFGSDQSGSQDVGADLQAQLLGEAIEALQQNASLATSLAKDIADRASKVTSSKEAKESTIAIPR